MTIFVRNKNNQTVVDIEVMKDDFRVVIDIEKYSEFLLSHPENISRIVRDFSELQELRGLWWEFEVNGLDPDMAGFLKNVVKSLIARYPGELFYAVD